ncbi:MAG: hypothetical protein QG626_418 [Patescibacteria group bacterium]|nr:hypothetical protein [Patescibacteria group bacterium]
MVVGTLGAPATLTDRALVSGLLPHTFPAPAGTSLRSRAPVVHPLRDALVVLAARVPELAVGGVVVDLPAVELAPLLEEPQAVLLVGVEPGVEILLDLVVRGQFHFSVIDHGSSLG